MGNKNKNRPALKPSQVQKVSKETGVEVKDLDRLPQDALQKIDDLVPDKSEEDELGDILGESDSDIKSPGVEDAAGDVVAQAESDVEVATELPSEETTDADSADQSSGDVDVDPESELPSEEEEEGDGESEEVSEDAETSEKKLVGHHPVTKEPLYI